MTTTKEYKVIFILSFVCVEERKQFAGKLGNVRINMALSRLGGSGNFVATEYFLMMLLLFLFELHHQELAAVVLPNYCFSQDMFLIYETLF